MSNKLSFKDYKNKVLGGWVGKCAGGILGAPIEGFKNFNNIPLTDDLFATNFANDDLDLQVLWLDMLLKKGACVREQDFNEHWLRHVEFPWCEYGIALRNMKVGLDNPSTGNHNNWYWSTGMGSPIRSEIWGMVNPGQPILAAFYAGIDSRLDHSGFSVVAEQYLSACASIAFFEKNLKDVLVKGLNYIPEKSDVAKLVNKVIEWDNLYGFDVVAGKIKSFYGDADFTSAPMNIGFIILSLLHTEKSFDFLIDAFHLGHDSDCVVATAGALLGIVLGYDAIPHLWKERVGNELLVSPEIIDIYCPETLTELAELTCKAGINFTKNNSEVEITAYPSTYEMSFNREPYAIHVETLTLPNPISKSNGRIIVYFENQTESNQEVEVKISSPLLKQYSEKISVNSCSKHSCQVSLQFLTAEFDYSAVKIPYTLSVTMNGETKSFEKGFPFYGSWLLFGPFIKDEQKLVKSDSKYPDHGLASLPSVKYMNQDKKANKEKFLDTTEIQNLISHDKVFSQPFNAQIISPKEMKINLKDYFCGTGERSLYLYTEVFSDNDVIRWLAMGSSNFLTVWFNDREVFKNQEPVRSYPIAHNIELEFKNGKNIILIRIDAFLDDFNFEVGLKEHGNKHPHQCQWDTNLQFNVLESLNQ